MGNNTYDIAIVGLGPAGATLARLLSSRFRTVAIDRKDLSGNKGFQKPCGGLLSPDAQKQLARFNLNLPADILVSPQIFSVRVIDICSGRTRPYQRFYLNMDRHKFDLWLCSLIPDSVEIKDKTLCRNIQKEGEGFTLSLKNQGEEETLSARYVIGSDGGNSSVRKLLFPKQKLTRYLAIQEWFHETHPTPFLSCVFDRKNKRSYSWSLSKDGWFIFGGAYEKKKAKVLFHSQKEALENEGFHFPERIRTEACLVANPTRLRQVFTGKQGAFLLGEAAGFISPSSYEGISYALESAALLSDILNSGAKRPETEYKKQSFSLKMKVAEKILKARILGNPFLRNLIMASGLQAISSFESKS